MPAWRPGESGNPAGRRADARRTKVREAIAKAAPGLIAGLIEQAKAGDVSAAKLLLDRWMPALKPEARPPTAPVPTDPAAILASVGAGQMTPGQGEQIMSLLLVEAKIREAGEFLARLDNIERALAELQR